jgi:hypothetical protein
MVGFYLSGWWWLPVSSAVLDGPYSADAFRRLIEYSRLMLRHFRPLGWLWCGGGVAGDAFRQTLSELGGWKNSG